MKNRTFLLLVALFVFVGLHTSTAFSQMPQARLWGIFPLGAQAGKETSIRLMGADLDGVDSLLFTHPGIKAVAKRKSASPYAEFLNEEPGVEAGLFTLNIGADVPPGVYEARAAGDFGMTNPRCFVVSSMEEVVEQEGNNSLAEAKAIPFACTVNGSIQAANDRDFFRFKAPRGTRVVIDCLASRIDSQLIPLLAVYNSRGIEIARSRIDKRRDALVDVVAADDGPMIVGIRDLLYKGSANHFYRLEVSASPHVDTIFPPSAVAGSEVEFLFLGRNLPGGQPAPEFAFNGIVPEKLVRKVKVPGSPGNSGVLSESRDFGLQRYSDVLQADLGASDGAYLWVANDPVLAEAEPNNLPGKATALKIPCEAAGRFYPRGDRDWFEFSVEEDGAFKVEVRSQRLGLGTDPAYMIQQVLVDKDGKETVKELKFQDDGLPNVGGGHFGTVSDDPFGEITAKKGNRYRVLVRDLYSDSRADPRNVYSLVIRRSAPDFEVVLLPGFPESDTDNKKNKPRVWGSLLRRNGTERYIAYVDRKNGYAGAIDLEFEGLPEFIKGGKGQIPAGKNSTTLLLHVGAEAADWEGLLKVFAKARLGDKDVRREATYGTLLWSGLSKARLTSGVGMAVSGAESSPFRIESSTLENEMAHGGSLELALKVYREEGAQGKITVNAVNLPPNVELKKFTVNDKQTEAKVKVTIKPGAPIGPQSFHFRCNTEVQYKRGLALVEVAKKRHEKMGGILKSISGVYTEKKKAADESRKKKSMAEGEVKKQTEALSAAKKVSEVASADLKTMAEKLKSAEDAVNTNPTDQGLVKAKEDAKEAAEASEAKGKEASEKFTQVENAHKASMDAARSADAALKKAEEEAKAAREREERAKKVLDAAKKDADGLSNAAKPKKVKVGIYSVPINLKITQAAFGFEGELAPGGLKVKAGQSADLPIKLQRLYGFNEEVKIKAVLKDVKGVKIADAAVAKGKPDTLLKIQVEKTSPPGKYDIELQATGKFGSANHTVKGKFQLVIEAPEEPKKVEEKK